MASSLFSLADLWIGRAAAPRPEALAEVRGFSPAVVITGASRGIGRSLASCFARAGRDVVLIARNAEPLDAVAREVSQSASLRATSARAAPVRAVPIALDVTRPDAPEILARALADTRLYMDVLVNNTGIGLAGPFAGQGAGDIERLITLNITAATRLMHAALPAMLARGRGGILNVASLGGLVPGPYQATYYASKAYLVSLTEAVAYEARGRGVRIAAVAPGPVNTAFHAAMRAENALYRSIVPAMSADAVARSAYRGYMMGRTVIAPGVLATAAALALKILPHTVSVPIVGALLSVGERAPPRA